MPRTMFGDLRLVGQTVLLVAILVALRAVLWELGVEGMSPTAVSAGIITSGIFVVGLLVAGTLSDYKEAERAPSDLAAGLHTILRECEAVHAVWGKPELPSLRRRLVAVVTTLRADIDAGDSRTCQAAIEEVSETFLELDDTDVPPNTMNRLRTEQAGLRKALLRVYQLQREDFLPSAWAMIVAIVVFILALLMFTNFDGLAESLATIGFLSFFFISLLRLLSIISTPFKLGVEWTEDDVSLFLLNEFVVQVHATEEGEMVVADIESHAEDVEEKLVEVESREDDPAKSAESATTELADQK